MKAIEQWEGIAKNPIFIDQTTPELNGVVLLLKLKKATEWLEYTLDHAYTLNQAAVRSARKELKTIMAEFEKEV